MGVVLSRKQDGNKRVIAYYNKIHFPRDQKEITAPPVGHRESHQALLLLLVQTEVYVAQIPCITQVAV